MSDAIKISYPFAMTLARNMEALLSPHCLRVEIAGSLRRKKPLVGDIEIVCIPAPLVDLFGGPLFGASRVERALRDDGFNLLKNGDYYKQAILPNGQLKFDIFLTTPEKWGVVFTLRTGSAAFSHRLVTQRKYGGLLPSNLVVKDGRIWTTGSVPLATPEEIDVFNALGLAWLDPQERE